MSIHLPRLNHLIMTAAVIAVGSVFVRPPWLVYFQRSVWYRSQACMITSHHKIVSKSDNLAAQQGFVLPLGARLRVSS